MQKGAFSGKKLSDLKAKTQIVVTPTLEKSISIRETPIEPAVQTQENSSIRSVSQSALENDQYLCIVPNSSMEGTNVNLPFEGDRMLAVILSKAFMLAEDTKITDMTITRQIKSN